jgi:PAS domain S-box-containing protein
MINNTSHSEAPNFAAANELALHLAAAENALRMFTADQVDAIVDANGATYLLRPAQEHLAQNERWLDAVIEGAADVITVVNRGGTILSQSRPVNRVLGYEQDELVGTSIFKLIRDEDLAGVHSAFFNVAEGIQEHATTQFNHQSRDGTYRMVEATLGKMRDCAASSVVFSLRPIGHPPRESIEFQRREAESGQAGLPNRETIEFQRRGAESPQAGLSKDRFLAMLSHELRTPVMPVLLCIGELQEDERFAEARPILAMMRRNIELQSRLLEELSDFTTVGQHKVRLRPEPIDVHEAVRFVLEICQSEIRAAQIELNLDLQAPNNIVLADSLRLQQVMWNLLRNAIKFSPPGSSISISSANEAPGDVTLLFVDQGIGIEAELLPLVFDPFQQSERTINQKHYGGLGLGMFIAKGLTEAQEGSLIVTSEGLGFGATFCLTLKLAPPAGMAQTILPLFALETPARQSEISG